MVHAGEPCDPPRHGRPLRHSSRIAPALASSAMLLLAFGTTQSSQSVQPGGPTVRFIQLAKLDGYRLDETGWSPRASLLGVRGTDGGFYVWDASRPEHSPKKILESIRVRSASWSPVGDRLLFVIGEPNLKDLRTLLAVSADGARVDTLLEEVAFWPAKWASDGSIYYRSDGRVHRMEALAAWSVPESIRAQKAPTFLMGKDPAFLGLGLGRVTPDSSEEVALSRLNSRLTGDHLLLKDEALSTGRYLVVVTGRNAATLILDGMGAIVVETGWACGYPSSMTPDGRLLAGEAADLAPRKGGFSSATVYISDTKAKWCTALTNAEDGTNPQLARTDSLIAYDGLHGGVLVGRLEIRAK